MTNCSCRSVARWRNTSGRMTLERMRRGRQRKLRAGLLLPWSRPPYGYRLSPDRPRDPAGVWVEVTEATVVQEIFARYVRPEGTLLGVAKSLHTEGIPSPRGQDYWQKSTIEGILTNPVYLGQVVAGRLRTRIPRQRQSPLLPVGRYKKATVVVPQSEWLRVATIPALISQEQFDQAQAKLAQNKQRARRNNTRHEYLLRALVSCGVCRLSCYGREKTGGYRYYVCHTKTEGTVAQRCRARYIPAQQLDAVVWQDLCDLLTHPEHIAQALTRAQAGTWLPQELQARREQLRQGRVSLEGQLERLTDAYQGGILPLEEYQRRRRAVEQNRQVMERQAEQLLAQVDRHQELAGMIISIEGLCQRVSSGLQEATFEQKRQLVELLIDRVVVTNGEVEIRYVFPTTPQSEHVRFGHLRTDYLLPASRSGPAGARAAPATLDPHESCRS
jgi:site-specific DNA recombinase